MASVSRFKLVEAAIKLPEMERLNLVLRTVEGVGVGVEKAISERIADPLGVPDK
jgi:hypothetical protein